MKLRTYRIRQALELIKVFFRKAKRVPRLFESIYIYTQHYLRPAYYRKLYTPLTNMSHSENLIVMLVISEISRDPRVERAAKALVEDGYRIKIYYPDEFSSKPDWGENIEFVGIKGPASSFGRHFPYLLGIEFLMAALENKPLAIHCHDLNTCVAGFIAARVQQCYLICDFHEWFSENVNWNERLNKYQRLSIPRKLVYKIAEKIVHKNADVTITVCESIGKMIEKETGGKRKIEIIRNIPPLNISSTGKYNLRRDLQLAEDVPILLYQGGVGPSRLIEPIIESLKYVRNCHFVIRGPGLQYYGEHYRQLASQFGVLERVSILDPVPSSHVVEAAQDADMGIWTLPNLSPNFYYALPNKVFEYMAAKLPLLVAAYPEPTKIVETFSIGMTFDPYDPSSIANAINKLAENKSLRLKMKINLENALSELNAGNEWNKLKMVYSKMRTQPPKQLRTI